MTGSFADNCPYGIFSIYFNSKGVTPPALIPMNSTANTFNHTEQSWLVRDETVTQVM